MMSMAKDLAIFDLDYTLTKRGTWARFIIRGVLPRPHLWIPLILITALSQIRYKRQRSPRIAVKSAMLKWSIAGLPRDKVERLAQSFAIREVKNGLRPGAVKALEFHRARGDEIMIASAAVDIVVKAISQHLDIKHYVATDMAWTEQNRLDTSFASPNCYAKEKLRRIIDYLDENPKLKQFLTNITMYSDSYSDLDVLQFSDVGVAVNPDMRLRQYAQEHGMRIEIW